MIQYKPLYFGTYSLLFISLVALFSTGEIPIHPFFWVVIYLGSLLGNIYWQRYKPKDFTAITNILAGTILFFSFGLLIYGLEYALIFLLLSIQAVKNLTLSSRRDMLFVHIVSLIIILYSASISKETYFIFFLILYTLASVYVLMADYVEEQLLKAKGGDLEFLGKISIPAKTTLLSCLIIVVAIIIYLLIPRIQSPKIKVIPKEEAPQIENELEKKGKLENDMKVRKFQGIKRFDIMKTKGALSNKILFYLHCDRPIYARGQAFSYFKGSKWESFGIAKTLIPARVAFCKKERLADGISQIYTIKEYLPTNTIFSGFPVSYIDFPSYLIEMDNMGSLEAQEPLKPGMVYYAISLPKDYRGHLSSDQALTEKSPYLQLPEGLSFGVRDLARTITDPFKDSFDKACAIERYLKENYKYSLSTLFFREDFLVEDFLFRLKEGHCELFATSMALMLRSIGIPARFVTGYAITRRNFNPITGYYEVRGLNAHAWVEAFIEDKWVSFEPTPGYEFPKIKNRFFIGQDLIPYISTYIDDTIKAYPKKWWSKFLKRLKDFFTYLNKKILGIYKAVIKVLWHSLIYIITSSILSLALYFLIKLYILPFIRKRRLLILKERNPRAFIIASYCEMCRVFEKKGIKRAFYLTPTEYEETLKKAFISLKDIISEITQIFLLARYSPLPQDMDSALRMERLMEGLQKNHCNQ